MTDKTVTWLQINNWIPIVVMVVMLVSTYGLLLQRVTIIETKLDSNLENQRSILKNMIDMQSQYNQLSIKVNTLEVSDNFIKNK